MNKIITVTIVCLGLVIDGYAQFIHRIGDISAGEIAMKECPFDPNSTAVVLIDEGFSDNSDYQLITFIHERIKILGQKGMEIADVTIPFQSANKFEKIENVEAMTINYDENGVRKEFSVEKKSIYTKKVNDYFSEVKFAFPQVKVGSILEYSYKSTKAHFGGLRTWNFQSRLPVCFSSYELRPPPNLEFTYQVQNDPKYAVVVKPFGVTHSIYFEMNNLPALGDEPYMDAREDYLQKVSFTVTKYDNGSYSRKIMTDWNEVAKTLLEDEGFGGQLKVSLKEPREEIHKSIAVMNDEQKMGYIYNFVRSKVKWNGEDSKYATDGLKRAWNDRTGNSACVNLLLVNLLRNEGLEAYPMLVSERNNGKINTGTPFIKQFNTVYALVVVKGKNFYFDATDEYTPSRLVPTGILNTTALIIKKDKGELVKIEDVEAKFHQTAYINASLSSEGILSASVISSSKDYARRRNIKNYRESSDKAKYVDQYIKDGIENLSVDSVEISGDNNDSSDFVQKFKFEMPLQNTGDYAFMNLNMFTRFQINPFISKNRFSNINFGYTTLENVSWLVKVPYGWTIEALPKNIRITNPDRSVAFSREIFYDTENKQISARVKIEFGKSFYSVDEYSDLAEFFKKMIDMFNEQIVFKKK